MNHGLMVALWMAITTIIIFWLWRTKEVAKVWRVSSAFVFCAFAISEVLCKFSGAFVYLLLGIASFYIYNRKHSSRLLCLLILFIPFYLFIRISNIISLPQIVTIVSKYFNPERVSSLMIRLTEEDLFGAKNLSRPLFGWGWMGRAWPVAPYTQAELIAMVDSFWIITFSTRGFLGLVSIYLSLGIGPFCVLAASGRPQYLPRDQNTPYAIDAIVLSIGVALFLRFATKCNGSIYILCSGALISYYTKGIEEEEEEPVQQEFTP